LTDDALLRARLAALETERQALQSELKARPPVAARRTSREVDESKARAAFCEWVNARRDRGLSLRAIGDELNDIDVHFLVDLTEGKRRIPQWIWPVMMRIDPLAFTRATLCWQPTEFGKTGTDG
jgi:hypothetical protein